MLGRMVKSVFILQETVKLPSQVATPFASPPAWTESPVAAWPRQHGQLTFHSSAKGIRWRKDSLSADGTEQFDVRMQELKSTPVPYTEMDSKWVRDLNIRLKTRKLLELNKGEGICDLICKDFSAATQKEHNRSTIPLREREAMAAE